MATDKLIDIKILIFPGILAICAIVALTWFPPQITQQEAELNPTEIPVLEPSEIPDTIQTPATTPISETEPVNASEDALEPNINLDENIQQNQEDNPIIEQHAV